MDAFQVSSYPIVRDEKVLTMQQGRTGLGETWDRQGWSSWRPLSHGATGVIGFHRPNNGAISQDAGSETRADRGAIEQFGTIRGAPFSFNGCKTDDSSIQRSTQGGFYD